MFRLVFEFLFSIFLCYSIIIASIEGARQQKDKPGVNEANERRNNLQSFPGSCPSSPSSSGSLERTHVPCAGEAQFPRDILYSSDSEASPTVQCKKCDLKVIPEGTAVIVRCFECYDIPPPLNKKN
ncbi:hypothetical protein ILUMI_08857 [Ignelater luminosus]|uniref:Uncharacterized protein n=1 Tax=Ignelater luminosus TaxID=2038154 RepID=A0A8K0D3L1_IGNLU|nr:hypothetical protein ILUMI_08857 [Ignelater luminosus]